MFSWHASTASPFLICLITSRSVATGGRQFFLEDGDYALYRDLLAERCRANGVQCWAYCLMPNPVHLILTPTIAESLSRAGGETHRRYSSFINARARVTGHVFQGRFSSRREMAACNVF
jgi:REP element-mobilizing transposase RayT